VYATPAHSRSSSTTPPPLAAAAAAASNRSRGSPRKRPPRNGSNSSALRRRAPSARAGVTTAPVPHARRGRGSVSLRFDEFRRREWCAQRCSAHKVARHHLDTTGAVNFQRLPSTSARGEADRAARPAGEGAARCTWLQWRAAGRWRQAASSHGHSGRGGRGKGGRPTLRKLAPSCCTVAELCARSSVTACAEAAERGARGAAVPGTARAGQSPPVICAAAPGPCSPSALGCGGGRAGPTWCTRIASITSCTPPASRTRVLHAASAAAACASARHPLACTASDLCAQRPRGGRRFSTDAAPCARTCVHAWARARAGGGGRGATCGACA